MSRSPISKSESAASSQLSATKVRPAEGRREMTAAEAWSKRLLSDDPGDVVRALRSRPGRELAAEELDRHFPRLLAHPDGDVAWLAVSTASDAALAGRDITSLLPGLRALFNDERVPSWRPGAPGHFSIGSCAIRAVGFQQVAAGQAGELERSLHSGDVRVRRQALSSLHSVKEPALLSALTPAVTGLLADPDPQLRSGAASVLTSWGQLTGDLAVAARLLDDPDDQVRHGVLSALDNLAEQKRPIDPVVPKLVEMLNQASPDAPQRQRILDVLLWFLLYDSDDGSCDRQVIVAGIDLATIPDLKRAAVHLVGDRPEGNQ